MLHEPDEHGAHKAAVLTFFVHVVVGGTYKKQLLVLAVHRTVITCFAKQMHVGVWLPSAKARAGSRATRATLLAVAAIVEAEFFFNMKRLVITLFMLVANYFVRARNNTAGTTCA